MRWYLQKRRLIWKLAKYSETSIFWVENGNSTDYLTSQYESFCCYKPDVAVEIYNKGMAFTLSQNLLIWKVRKH